MRKRLLALMEVFKEAIQMKRANKAEKTEEVEVVPSVADEIQGVIAELQATHATGIHNSVERLKAIVASLTAEEE